MNKNWSVIILPHGLKYFYTKLLVENTWFIHLDLPKLIKFPSWVAQWLQEFGPHECFLPYYVNTKYELFSKKLSEFKHNHIFFHFLIFYRIPWILSWQYCLGVENNHPILGQKLFSIWWDKFTAPINLDQLPIELFSSTSYPSQVSSIFIESVSLFVQKESTSKKSEPCRHYAHQWCLCSQFYTYRCYK